MIVDRVRELIEVTVVKWRRRRLLSAYARVVCVRTGNSVGFTPTIHALESAERDGVLIVEDEGTVTWLWPVDTDPADDQERGE